MFECKEATGMSLGHDFYIKAHLICLFIFSHEKGKNTVEIPWVKLGLITSTGIQIHWMTSLYLALCETVKFFHYNAHYTTQTPPT